MNKNKLPDNQSNFLLYTGNDGKVNIDVFLKDENVCLAYTKGHGRTFRRQNSSNQQALVKYI